MTDEDPKTTEIVNLSIDDIVENDVDFLDLVEDAEYAREGARLIRIMRMHANLSQEQLARELKITQARVSALERSAGRDGPSYTQLRRIAKVCGFRELPRIRELMIKGNSIESEGHRSKPAINDRFSRDLFKAIRKSKSFEKTNLEINLGNQKLLLSSRELEKLISSAVDRGFLSEKRHMQKLIFGYVELHYDNDSIIFELHLSELENSRK